MNHKFKYYIAPPFGNHLTRPDMYSVMGTYTLHSRPGLIKQLLKTLRYSFFHKGWINQLGLRNPGISRGIQKYFVSSNKRILSIHGFNKEEWEVLAEYTRGLKVELNLSCPNVMGNKGNVKCPVELFGAEYVILKMSPLTTEDEIVSYMERGVKKWHFSNTLPIAQGGLSGRTLMVYNKNLIKFTLGEDKCAKIIGGGGIRNMSDVRFYKDLGCSGVSLGTVLFKPFALNKFNTSTSD